MNGLLLCLALVAVPSTGSGLDTPAPAVTRPAVPPVAPAPPQAPEAAAGEEDAAPTGGRGMVTSRPRLFSLPEEERSLVLQWLWEEPDDDAGRAALGERITALGPHLEAVFWEAFRQGPAPADADRYSRELAGRYPERQAWLRESGSEVFGREETTRLLAMSQDAYVAAELDDALAAFRLAALRGLSLVGTKDSEPELARIAADASDPAHVVAAEALKSISQRRL